MKVTEIRWFSAAIAVFAVLALSGGASARGREGSPGQGMDRPWPGPRMASELKLTDQQKEQIQAIHEKGRGQTEQDRNDLKKAREELREAMKGKKGDADLRKLHDQVVEAQGRMAKARFDRILEVRSVLTDEQRKLMSEKFESRTKQGRGYRGRGGKGFGGPPEGFDGPDGPDEN